MIAGSILTSGMDIMCGFLCFFIVLYTCRPGKWSITNQRVLNISTNKYIVRGSDDGVSHSESLIFLSLSIVGYFRN
jgi:hypothetical protein